MLLATFQHHSAPRRQKTARSGVWGHEQNYTAKVRKPPTPQPELFSLEEEPGGCRPAPLSEVAGWQEKVERHFVEHLAEFAPMVQILDALVPQMVDQDNVTDALRRKDLSIAEQVIEVPKFIIDVIPSRSSVPEPQIVEQLMEVPTVLSPLRIAEQIVGIPVSQGGGVQRLQSLRPGQSSTAVAEQIVSPAPYRGGLRGGLHGFPPVQGSAVDFPVPLGDADEGVFRGFFKVRRLALAPGRNWPRTRAHPRRALMAL